LGNIYLHTNQSAFDQRILNLDTIKYRGLNIISLGQPTLKPIVLDYTTTLYKGDTYSKSKVDQTYKRFSQLQVFQSVNIQLEATEAKDSSEFNMLDTHIFLQPSKKQLFSVDPKLTHRDGALGVYANLVYSNRNLFRGAEKLEIRNILGFEAAQSLTSSDADATNADQVTRNVKLNTFEIGPEIIFRVPRILPLSLDRFKRSNDPQTSISASLNYQSRPDYERTLSRFVYGNSLIENPSHGSRIFADWAEISVIKIKKSTAFEKFIVDLNDEFLANSYRDHLISATRLGWVVNTQSIVQQPKYMYFRAYIEGAGNLMRFAYKSTKAPLDEAGSYELAGIRFAQYVKSELDLRLYRNINETNALAGRANFGWGLPLKNLSALPFEKSFFAGGSNSIRAWQARTLGPGSYRDTTAIRTFNNIGEIKIEFNLEYRFKMTQMFHGAWFLDMGNIWLQKPDPLRPGSDFNRKEWLSEVAVGTGFGIRLDFEFFLVRFDLGIQVKDPSKVKGERWMWEPKDQFKIFMEKLGGTPNAIDATFNLGIGYPF
jgi:outer membrane protein assembly factor BamA